jgi:hypothetical protein
VTPTMSDQHICEHGAAPVLGPDLVAAIDSELVAASEWQLDGAAMHILVVPAAV